MTSHPRQKPYPVYLAARALGVSRAAVLSKVRNGTLRRNDDGTIPAAEVMRWRAERRAMLTRDLAALNAAEFGE